MIDQYSHIKAYHNLNASSSIIKIGGFWIMAIYTQVCLVDLTVDCADGWFMFTGQIHDEHADIDIDSVIKPYNYC